MKTAQMLHSAVDKCLLPLRPLRTVRVFRNILTSYDDSDGGLALDSGVARSERTLEDTVVRFFDLGDVDTALSRVGSGSVVLDAVLGRLSVRQNHAPLAGYLDPTDAKLLGQLAHDLEALADLHRHQAARLDLHCVRTLQS